MDKDYILDIICDIYSQVGINELGFDVIDVCDKLGIKVLTYSCIREENTDLYESIIKHYKDGFSLVVYGRPCILYNDEIKPKERIIHTLNHELGHIVLNHYLSRKDLSLDEKEKEANLFASMFYTPFVLLISCDVIDVDEICNVCHISKRNAEIQNARLLNKVNEDGYYLSPKEKELLDIFEANQANKGT